MVAKEVLVKTENDLAMGRSPYTHFENVYFEDIANLIVIDYKINRKSSLNRVERSIGHLKKMFAGYSVSSNHDTNY